MEEVEVWEEEVLSCPEEVDHASVAFSDPLVSVRCAGQMLDASLEEALLPA